MAEDATTDPRSSGVFDLRFARQLARLVGIYWRSPDARWGVAILSIAVVLELATVWGNVRVADAERRILDALQQREAGTFLAAIAFFLQVTLLFVFAAVYRIYARGVLEIRWRRGLTAHYVDRWIGRWAALLAELHGHQVDNPDQRIQEDVRDFVASALGLSLSLLAAVATLISFGDVLWQLSANWPLPFDAAGKQVPGLMLWVAVAYALSSMWLTHRVGRALVPINFDKLRVEADFRYGLVRFRENAEAVALARGEAFERKGAVDRFGRVVDNWWQLIRAQRNLGLLTTGIGQANAIVPILVAAPAYFEGLITLGSIVQIRIAYSQVSSALTWFVYAYQEIARCRANIERLSTLSETIDATERDVAAAGIRVVPTAGDDVVLEQVRIEEPGGRVLVDGATATIVAGDRLAITGPSGTGKTLLVRAIAGIWPFGAGTIDVPARPRMMFLNQRPYVPMGTMRAAASYPATEGEFPDDLIRETLRLFGLDTLATRLDDVEQWEQILSPHELQRLALGRVLLHEPDWLFLDKSTSALDEAMERRAYELLASRLPATTVVSLSDRPSIERYHVRRWTLAPTAGRVALEAA
jgi:putative ATP-binding cassette transporter